MGKDDDRYLWPEMLRVIREIQPTWVVAENVRGLITIEQGLVFEQVQLDLEANGYEVQSFCIPACAINAPHRRDRFFFIANADGFRRDAGLFQEGKFDESTTESLKEVSNIRYVNCGNNTFEFRGKDKSFFCGEDDGLPDRVDRLYALGNAIVPQVAYEIFKAIEMSCNQKMELVR